MFSSFEYSGTNLLTTPAITTFMRRATATALFLSAVMALAAVSVCAPFSDASQSDSVSVIVPSDGLSVEDPLALILGFEHVSAEVGRAEGTVLILMTGAPYEDDEIYIAVTEAIGPELFVTSSEIGSFDELEFIDGEPPLPPEQRFGSGVDLDFLEQMLAFVQSHGEWMPLAEELASEIRAQEEFSSRMVADCLYRDSRFCEVSSDRRDDECDDRDLVEPVIVEEPDETQPEAIISPEPDSFVIEIPSEVGDSGVLPVIGRGTII